MTVFDIAAETIFRRSDSASMSRLSPDEGVMVAFEAGVYVRLNESAMLVWDLVDGVRACGEIMVAYAQYFKISGEVSETDVLACLQHFLDLQVIHV